MSLSECLACIKKGFMYTGITRTPCVRKLSLALPDDYEIPHEFTTRAACYMEYFNFEIPNTSTSTSTPEILVADLPQWVVGLIWSLVAAITLLFFIIFIIWYKGSSRSMKLKTIGVALEANQVLGDMASLPEVEGFVCMKFIRGICSCFTACCKAEETRLINEQLNSPSATRERPQTCTVNLFPVSDQPMPSAPILLDPEILNTSFVSYQSASE